MEFYNIGEQQSKHVFIQVLIGAPDEIHQSGGLCDFRGYVLI